MTHTRSEAQPAEINAGGNAVVTTSAAGWGGGIPRREARESRSGLAWGSDGFSGRLDTGRLTASGKTVRGKGSSDSFGDDFVGHSLVDRGSITGTIGPNRSRVGRVVSLSPGRDTRKKGRRRLVVRIAVGAHGPGSAVNLRAFSLAGGGAGALALPGLAVGCTSGGIGRELGMDEAAPLAVGAGTGDPEGAADLSLVLQNSDHD